EAREPGSQLRAHEQHRGLSGHFLSLRALADRAMHALREPRLESRTRAAGLQRILQYPFQLRIERDHGKLAMHPVDLLNDGTTERDAHGGDEGGGILTPRRVLRQRFGNPAQIAHWNLL